jgi:NADH-quinone oxidoreductase subunit M
MNLREVAFMAPLVILTILFGFYPAPLLDVMAVSVNKLIANYEAALAAAAELKFAVMN